MQIREVVVGFVDPGVLAVVRLPFDQDDHVWEVLILNRPAVID